MKIKLFKSSVEMGQAAAREAAAVLQSTITHRGQVRIIAATGASQMPFLQSLTGMPGIDWKKVEMFHLDEYVGLPLDHPASFRKYLLERLIRPTGMGQYHLLDGEGNVQEVCRTVGEKLHNRPVQVAFVGIGENGHLAFNDPPADFATQEPYIVVNLDEACRKQQVGEGWFRGMDEVPRQAISMSIHQIMQAQKILCIVPDQRKAKAVQACLEGEISPLAPASILRRHPDVTCYLDDESSSLLNKRTLALAEAEA